MIGQKFAILLASLATQCLGAGLFESCTNTSECPVNSECKFRSCDLLRCLCSNGYYPDDVRDSCLIPVYYGDSCADNFTTCAGISTYCNTSGICDCALSHAPSLDGKYCTLGKPLLGEYCDQTTGCEFIFQKCEADKCVCHTGLRSYSPEEAAAYSTLYQVTQCVPETHSLDMCNGINVTSIESTASTRRGSRSASSTVKISRSTAPSTVNIRLSTAPSTIKVGLLESCTSDDECPLNSECKPRGCQLYRCLCSCGYYPSDIRDSCKTPVYYGESCADSSATCAGIFTYCNTSDICDCSNGLFPSTDGQHCNFGKPLLGETCDQTTGCAFISQKCEANTCECQPGLRPYTPEEAAADNLSYELFQCLLESFSLDMCNGINLTAIESTATTRRGSISASSTIKISRSTAPPTAKISTISTSTAPSTVHIRPSTAPSTIKVGLLESCTNDDECPLNSECKPLACQLYRCLCSDGYYPSDIRDSCKTPVYYGESCADSSTTCAGIFTYCNTSDICDCSSGLVPSTDCQHCNFGKPLLGETCDQTTGCAFISQKCEANTCECQPGLRPYTPEEAAADSLSYELFQCLLESFSLDMCNGNNLTDIKSTLATTSTTTAAIATATTQRAPSTTAPSTIKISTSTAPTTTIAVGLLERCTSDAECPLNSACKASGLDQSRCVCSDGYYPNDNRDSCKTLIYYGESCADSSTICAGIFTYCNTSDICDCTPGLIPSTGGKHCSSGKPLLGETCEQTTGCALVLQMCGQANTCECQTGWRPFTPEEDATDSALYGLFQCILEEIRSSTPETGHLNISLAP